MYIPELNNLLNDYCNHRGTSTVYTAIDKSTGIEVAIKIIDVSEQPIKELIVSELRVLQDIRHPNIVDYLDSYLLQDTLWVMISNNLIISMSILNNICILYVFFIS